MYSNTLKTLYLTAFYAPVIPIGSAISAGALILSYFIDKVREAYDKRRTHKT
jgi:hypothetical protein